MSATVVGPFCHVDAAAVSLLKGGEYHLLLRTDLGPVQFIVPAPIAHGFLRLTNPPCIAPPSKPRAQPLTKPSGQIL